jgi:mannose-6-phosphate isomerase-like protein (cupin superfamily)
MPRGELLNSGYAGCHINEATMFTKEQHNRTDYTVKNVETVAAGKDVQARVFTLAPGEVIPWHSHSEIADHFFVLDGELTVETRAPDDYRTLGIGERYQVNAGHAHQTSNRGTGDCRFLIVQGVGRYDFLRSPL